MLHEILNLIRRWCSPLWWVWLAWHYSRAPRNLEDTPRNDRIRYGLVGWLEGRACFIVRPSRRTLDWVFYFVYNWVNYRVFFLESSKGQCRKELTVLLSEFSMQAAILTCSKAVQMVRISSLIELILFLHSSSVFWSDWGVQGSDVLLHNNWKKVIRGKWLTYSIKIRIWLLQEPCRISK